MSREGDRRESRRGERQSWPIRMSRLGEQGGDDLSRETTAEERLAMVSALTLEAWTLAGGSSPAYGRADAPVSVRRLGSRPR